VVERYEAKKKVAFKVTEITINSWNNLNKTT
jgi:hypothetical protein